MVELNHSNLESKEMASAEEVFGPKKHGVTGGWRKLHNEELHNFYFFLYIISVCKSKMVRLDGHVACTREPRNAYKIFVRKFQGQKLHGRHRCHLEDNIKMDFREISHEDMNWSQVA
jgi:hypothetical protein